MTWGTSTRRRAVAGQGVMSQAIHIHDVYPALLNPEASQKKKGEDVESSPLLTQA